MERSRTPPGRRDRAVCVRLADGALVVEGSDRSESTGAAAPLVTMENVMRFKWAPTVARGTDGWAMTRYYSISRLWSGITIDGKEAPRVIWRMWRVANYMDYQKEEKR